MNLKRKIQTMQDVIDELKHELFKLKMQLVPKIEIIKENVEQNLIKKCQASISEAMNYKDTLITNYRKQIDNKYPEINSDLNIDYRDLQDQSVYWHREMAYVNFLKVKNESLMLTYKELYEKLL